VECNSSGLLEEDPEELHLKIEGSDDACASSFEETPGEIHPKIEGRSGSLRPLFEEISNHGETGFRLRNFRKVVTKRKLETT